MGAGYSQHRVERLSEHLTSPGLAFRQTKGNFVFTNLGRPLRERDRTRRRLQLGRHRAARKNSANRRCPTHCTQIMPTLIRYSIIASKTQDELMAMQTPTAKVFDAMIEYRIRGGIIWMQ